MINYLTILLFLFPKLSFSFKENITQTVSSNIIDRQKENLKIRESGNNNLTFILKSEFNKMINFDEGIPFYISLLDYNRKNYLKIPNNRTSYLTNYKNLLGKSDKYFLNSFNMMYPMKEELGNNRRSVLSVMDDVLLKKIYTNKSVLYIMRNQFLSNYENLTNSIDFLKFYDLNIIFNVNEEDIEFVNNLFDKYSNVLIIKDKYSKDGEVMEKFIKSNNYSNVFEHISYKDKMEKIGRIKKEYDIILSNQNLSEVNLLNFLIIPQIREIKRYIKDIEIESLPLLYYYKSFNPVEFNNQIGEIHKKVMILYQYLSKYSFTKSDFGIDCYYFAILMLFIAIASVHIIQTLREFDFAVQRKVK